MLIFFCDAYGLNTPFFFPKPNKGHLPGPANRRPHNNQMVASHRGKSIARLSSHPLGSERMVSSVWAGAYFLGGGFASLYSIIFYVSKCLPMQIKTNSLRYNYIHAHDVHVLQNLQDWLFIRLSSMFVQTDWRCGRSCMPMGHRKSYRLPQNERRTQSMLKASRSWTPHKGESIHFFTRHTRSRNVVGKNDRNESICINIGVQYVWLILHFMQRKGDIWNT